MQQKVTDGRCNQPKKYRCKNGLLMCTKIIKIRNKGKSLKYIAEITDNTIPRISCILRGKTANSREALKIEKLNKDLLG